MNHTYLKILLLVSLFIPGIAAAAVTKQDFEVQTTRDLLDLCTATVSDPYFKEAIHFCHGYLVGAYHYHEAEHRGPDGKPLVCLPDSGVTRNEAIKYVVSWMQAHPKLLGEPPVETQFRALIEKWPCKN